MTTVLPTGIRLRGVPPLITVNRNSPTPLYQQIYNSYRTKILDRNLRPGQIVPSSRELARELRVSRLPVLNAYAQLLAEGYFESKVGAGTFIASAFATDVSGDKPPREARKQSRTVSVLASTLPPYQRPTWAEQLGPFQVGQPALQEFPVQIWSRLVARYSRNMKFSGLQYGDPMGLLELREAISNYLRTSRGVRCEADQIIIVSGSQQALDISCRVLLDPASPAWVEEPGYWLVHHVLKAAGCRVVPVPVDAEGLNVAAGIKSCRNARAAFVAPSHQYPLGVTMTATRRLELLQWAQSADSWIIEDDYDSEYRYDTMPISSLQGLDTNGRVIYIGTFSKVLFPSLRLGYIVVPRDLVERFVAMRQLMDLCPSHGNQAVLADFIREGHFSRHIRKMRKLYAERRHLSVEELERELGDSCRVIGAQAGMHVTLMINSGMNDQAIAAKAIQRKLLLSALSLSYVGSKPQQGFVLGFGNTQTRHIPAAVRSLKKLLIG
jgi:GntR family transcriptional regulator/MocR family aminotransferase